MGDNRIGKELGSALRGVLDRDPRLFKEMIGATGLARRKAHYFVNICRAFDLLPIPRARLNALGWIKLQMLAGHIEADNADTLLKMAETNTTARLCKLLKREKSSANRRIDLLLRRQRLRDARRRAGQIRRRRDRGRHGEQGGGPDRVGKGRPDQRSDDVSRTEITTVRLR